MNSFVKLGKRSKVFFSSRGKPKCLTMDGKGKLRMPNDKSIRKLFQFLDNDFIDFIEVRYFINLH